jgi:hypothetical protein
VQPIHSSARDPGFDVVGLAIASDGKQITFTATLKDPPGSFATEVLTVYFDTDNRAADRNADDLPRVGRVRVQGGARRLRRAILPKIRLDSPKTGYLILRSSRIRSVPLKHAPARSNMLRSAETRSGGFF